MQRENTLNFHIYFLFFLEQKKVINKPAGLSLHTHSKIPSAISSHPAIERHVTIFNLLKKVGIL